MITQLWAQKFAQEWIEAWNAHDIQRVLSHYTDDLLVSSQDIAEVAGEITGTLKGKTRVSAHWQTTMERFPDLNFQLLEVFTAVNSIIIYYEAVFLGKLGTEVLFIGPEGKAFEAVAHYN